MAATLADINDTLVSVDKNTQQTSKGITGFLSYLKTRDRKEDRKDLESDREKRKVATRATSGSSSSSSGRGFSLPSFNLPTVAGLLGGATLLGSKLLKRGVFGAILTAFADPIADFLLPGGKGNDEIREEVKKYLTGGLEGAGIGFLLFGKKGGIIGAILGALTKNPKVDKELGDLADNLGKLATVIFGKDYKGGMAKIARTISNTAGSGLERLNNLIEGKNFSTESINELRKDILGAAGVLGVFGFFASSKFRKSLTSLSGLKQLRIIAALTSVASLLGYSLSNNTNVDRSNPNEMRSKEMDGPNMFEVGAGAAGATYLAYKGAKGFKNLAGSRGVDPRTMDTDYSTKIKQANKYSTKSLSKVGLTNTGSGVQQKGGKFATNEQLNKLLGNKYPRLFSGSGLLKFAKGFAPLALLSGYFTRENVLAILNDPTLSEKQKKDAVGNILGQEINAVTFGAIGAALAGLKFGPLGIAAGGIAGTLMSSVAPNVAGGLLADFFMGKGTMSESEVNRIFNPTTIKNRISAPGNREYEDVTSSIGLTSRLPAPNLAKARDTLERYQVNNPMFDKSYEGGSRSGNNLINNNNINMSNQSMIMGSAKSNDNENPLNTRLAIGLV